MSASISPSFSPSPSMAIVQDVVLRFKGSPSVSPSISPSVSLSVSPSVSFSISPSASVSLSISESPSLSPSPSMGVSESESVSPSVSLSISPSISPSASVSPSISPSVSISVSPSESPSVSLSISLSASVSLSVSPSESPSVSISISPSISPSESVSLSISPSISPSVSRSVSPSVSPSVGAVGSVSWGHLTGVTQDNVLTFAGNWTGTGSITGTNDAETMCIDEGEYMMSEIVETGDMIVVLTQNTYDPGGEDAPILEYRTGATSAECFDAAWIIYTAPFLSAGYVQIKVTNADIFYVDATGGSDSNPGTLAEPWKTIDKVNGETFTAGDHILFKRGETWSTVDDVLRITWNGSAENHIVFGAYGSGALPIISPTNTIPIYAPAVQSYITVENIDCNVNGTGNFGMQVRLSNSIIRNCVAREAAMAGILLGSDSAYTLIENCTCYNNAQFGIQGYTASGSTIHDIIVQNNTCYANGTDDGGHHGIYLGGNGGTGRCAYNLTMRGNTCYENASCGVKYNTVEDSIIEQNYCYDNGLAGVFLSAETSRVSSNNIVRNNICYSNSCGIALLGDGVDDNELYHNTLVLNYAAGWAGISYYYDGLSGNTAKNNIIYMDNSYTGAPPIRFAGVNARDNNITDYNLIYWKDRPPANGIIYVDGVGYYTWTAWQALGKDTHSINASDPVFVTDFTDLHIQTTSPAKNTGETGLGVTDDYEGTTRDAQPDMGAYEYVA